MKKSKANYWQNKVVYAPKKSFQQYLSSQKKVNSSKSMTSPPCEPPCETGCGACDD